MFGSGLRAHEFEENGNGKKSAAIFPAKKLHTSDDNATRIEYQVWVGCGRFGRGWWGGRGVATPIKEGGYGFLCLSRQVGSYEDICLWGSYD